MLSNIRQAKSIYPGWQVVIFHDGSVPQAIVEEVLQQGAITLHVTSGIYGMFWRFYAADLPDCEYVVFRDSDSRLSFREKAAVDEWIRSGNAIHVMRDHPYHQDKIDERGYHMLGGMWGIKGKLLNMTSMIERFTSGKELGYGADQFFLNQIYERYSHSATIHDEFFSKCPFPVKRDGYRFVGERFDDNEQPAGKDWKALKAYYDAKKWRNILLRKMRAIKKAILR
jgi:hypothetical protein